MEVVLFEQANKDIVFWKKSGQKQIMTRITNLLKDIQKHPYSGIGKPEELKYELSGWWSRRINREHRLIYRVVNNEIQVLSLRYHYT
ncbi:MAG: Txe/YoeB family addiction module toxin [Marinilabiliales bacterium]|nr:MAG: Txe/YoeB family addiction module toxin [Marinilabiliales bacterium]